MLLLVSFINVFTYEINDLISKNTKKHFHLLSWIASNLVDVVVGGGGGKNQYRVSRSHRTIILNVV
jgi:hypothetical protein